MVTSAPGAGWPERLQAALSARVGDAWSCTPLPSARGRDVDLVTGPRGQVVLKAAPHRREVRFYRDLVPELAPGIVAPECYWADDDWLVLEHVDEPLPRERWLADTSVMRALAALHRSSSARSRLVAPFRPTWTAELTAAALARIELDRRAAVKSVLDRLRGEAGRWLTGDVLVSADPDPGNWGVRRDGALVLFDWERVGLATPALDVALTVRGLPSRDQLGLAGTAYLDVQQRDHVHWSPEDFVFGLTVAKAWECVDVLARAADRAPAGARQRAIADALPSWLAKIP